MGKFMHVVLDGEGALTAGRSNERRRKLNSPVDPLSKELSCAKG